MADNVSMGAPTSGAYGEAADLAALKGALPAGAIGNPTPTSAGPPMPPVSTQPVSVPSPTPPGRPTGGQPPPGLPAVLAGPTQRPNVPVGTPLSVMTAPVLGDPTQARVAILDHLTNDPTVSPETRAWASSVLRVLRG